MELYMIRYRGFETLAYLEDGQWKGASGNMVASESEVAEKYQWTHAHHIQAMCNPHYARWHRKHKMAE